MTAEVRAEPGASGLCPGEWRAARVGVEPGEGWETQAGSGRRWLWNIFTNELNLVVHDSGVMLIFLFAGLVYPVLYNGIYQSGTVEEMPVAVVDASQGPYSRRYVQELGATRECAVAFDCLDMQEAQALMAAGKVHGIVQPCPAP